jgi:hypothetical protein
VYTPGKFIVAFAFETSPGFGFAYAAPLLEEEGDLALAALIAQGQSPLFLRNSGTSSTFSADDHPIDPVQVQLSNIF